MRLLTPSSTRPSMARTKKCLLPIRQIRLFGTDGRGVATLRTANVSACLRRPRLASKCCFATCAHPASHVSYVSFSLARAAPKEEGKTTAATTGKQKHKQKQKTGKQQQVNGSAPADQAAAAQAAAVQAAEAQAAALQMAQAAAQQQPFFQPGVSAVSHQSYF